LTVFIGILAFFLILSVLVMVHELGHFTCAKLMGVRVEEFGLGFPPRVKGWRRGGTLYSLNALPLGGFVRMVGENGEQDAPDSFGSHPAWQRFIILVAGPTMNILLAVAIFFFIFLHGMPRQLNTVTKVVAGSPAAHAGLMAGDTIVAIDGVHVHYRDDLGTQVDKHIGEVVAVQVQRRSDRVTAMVLARSHPPRNQGSFGIELGKMTTMHYSPIQSAGQAVGVVGTMVSTIPQIFGHLLSSNHNNGVVGPIGIARVTTDTVSQEPQNGPSTLLALMALLSANLGVLNLLPFPALDGGRIVFVAVSAVRRRNLDPQVEGAIHAIGMAVLLLFILLISYNDILHWLTGGNT